MRPRRTSEQCRRLNTEPFSIQWSHIIWIALGFEDQKPVVAVQVWLEGRMVFVLMWACTYKKYVQYHRAGARLCESVTNSRQHGWSNNSNNNKNTSHAGQKSLFRIAKQKRKRWKSNAPNNYTLCVYIVFRGSQWFSGPILGIACSCVVQCTQMAKRASFLMYVHDFQDGSYPSNHQCYPPCVPFHFARERQSEWFPGIETICLLIFFMWTRRKDCATIGIGQLALPCEQMRVCDG